MELKFAAKTHPGKVRKVNQDSFGIVEHQKLFFVCDGMGGHRAGDFASKTAVEFISKIMLTDYPILKSLPKHWKQFQYLPYSCTQHQNVHPGNPLHIIPASQDSPRHSTNSQTLWEGFDKDLGLPAKLITALRLTNRLLYQFANRYGKLEGMGTTFAGVLFDEKKNIAHILHIGDSRVYRLRAGILEQLTEDHSKVQKLVKLGKITKEEAQTAEIKSIITRALGRKQKIKIDYRIDHLKDNDCFLVCSDGLTGELEDESIRKVISSDHDDLNLICEMLIKAANDAGGRDNITVIVIKVTTVRSNPLSFVEGGIMQVAEISNSVKTNTILTSARFTISEETDEELQSEDKLLKVLLRKIPVEIPKEVKERVLFYQPLLLAFVFVLGTISTWMILTKIANKEKNSTIN
ncbi:MAG: hypothetical protein QME68_04870 [Elusimicrobiota bacterium]|nr:hypothetical protein [Elusimicrobiota bacterium]